MQTFQATSKTLTGRTIGLTLLLLARIGGRGRALEKWALKRLGVWPEGTDEQ